MNILETVTQEDYKLLNDAYNGAGGFKDGGYLVKRPREKEDSFLVRKALCYYLNYVKPVVDSHVNPIFRKEAARDWGGRKDDTGTVLFSRFFDDIDTVKTKLPKFIKRAARVAKLNGASFIVVDNTKDQPGTMADVLEKRAFPYAYIIKPSQVTDYTVNKAGVLTSITYSVAGDGSGSSGEQKEVWTWTAEKWTCSGSGTGAMEKSGKNTIGRIPVVPLLGAEADPGNLKPLSEFYSIARANKRIFNLCSEIDELITKQAFSIFLYPMGASSDANKVKEMLVGTENAVMYDGAVSSPPGYATPDGMPLEQLRAERADLITEIYRMAQQSHTTGVEAKTSGVSKAWDFEGANQTLSGFAANCEAAEQAIADLFEAWTNETVGYIVNYSDDFGIVDVSAALDGVSKALDLGVGGKFDTAVKKKAVDVYLNDLDEDEFDIVMADIEARGEIELTAPIKVQNSGDAE